MASDAGLFGKELQEVRAPIHRFDRTYAQALDICLAQNATKQIDKTNTAWKVAAPAA
jgi:hypothetical protein